MNRLSFTNLNASTLSLHRIAKHTLAANPMKVVAPIETILDVGSNEYMHWLIIPSWTRCFFTDAMTNPGFDMFNAPSSWFERQWCFERLWAYYMGVHSSLRNKRATKKILGTCFRVFCTNPCVCVVSSSGIALREIVEKVYMGYELIKQQREKLDVNIITFFHYAIRLQTSKLSFYLDHHFNRTYHTLVYCSYRASNDALHLLIHRILVK